MRRWGQGGFFVAGPGASWSVNQERPGASKKQVRPAATKNQERPPSFPLVYN
ncbi:MAG: hypothetical protein HQL02_09285 [Nitrospirae bacterium]|nr:hypothetical protein [Nitrospirota bacterium]